MINFEDGDILTASQLNTVVSYTVPTGGVLLYTAGPLPDGGWLFCDGSAVSRSTYANLFSVIGTNYGAGNGSTTFNVPDMKSRVPVGADPDVSIFNTLGNTGGAISHTLTAAQMPVHSHDLDMYETVAEDPGYGLDINAGFVNRVIIQGFPSTNLIADTGGGEAHNNLQPYNVFLYIIKT